jgi:hypothetical protein
MTSNCSMPDVQMALLDAARFGDALDDELSNHLDACDACRAAVERLRRMAETWMSDEAVQPESERAVTIAAERFAARAARRRESSWRVPLSFAFAGATAALAFLAATHRLGGSPTGATELPMQASQEARDVRPVAPGAGPNVEPASAGATARAILAVPHVEGPRGIAPLVNGLRIELKSGESAKVALANGQASELRGPCAVEVWSSSTEVGGWRLTPVQLETADAILPEIADQPGADAPRALATDAASRKASKGGSRERAINSQPSNAEPAVAEDGSNEATTAAPLPKTSAKVKIAWERATEAMGRDDFAAADAAFGELCSSSDAATRDKARLARAQLWITAGRGAEVQTVLMDLAANGTTPLVRQRAAEFLSNRR